MERITQLCKLLGDPQDAVPSVHVAGTNGKGSTAAMTASVLSAAGYKTGLYTSPYISDILECIQIDGRNITRDEFAEAANEIKGVAESMAGEGGAPTEFELETALAFLWFSKSGCNAMVIETGLGGRLDATNVLKHPRVSVLTSLSLDHTNILGGTIREIATEKCGIIKPGGLVVSYPLQPPEALEVIRSKAGEVGNSLIVPDLDRLKLIQTELDGTDIEYKELALHIPLIGKHQIYNAVTVVETALALREQGFTIPDGSIVQGIRSARMPLRQEVIRREPLIIVDGAHNPDGLTALAETMRTLFAGRKTAVVMGMLADKEYQKSIALVAPLCGRFIASKPASPRALAGEIAADCARPYCADVAVEDDYAKALSAAVDYAGVGGAVVVCGSLYLAGLMREIYFEKFAG